MYGGVSSSYSAIGVGHPHNPFSGIMDIILIIDFPFSFVLDTILLPVTGSVSSYHYLRNRKYSKNEPLFQAIEQNDKSKLENLLSKGLSINAFKDNRKITPVMVAASLGNVEILQFLLENKADVHAVTTENETALDFSLRAETEDAYKLLSAYNISIVDNKTVFEAANLGKEHALIDLLKKKPDAIKGIYYGKNLAMVAIEASISEPTILDILNQIDINKPDDEGDKVVHYAARYGKLKVLDFLLSKNVPVDQINGKNQTPFLIAVEADRLDAVKYLYEKKANIHSDINQAALSISISHEKDDIYKFLLSKNFKVTDPSILFYAISSDKQTIASDLLKMIPNAHWLKSDDDIELIHYSVDHNFLDGVKFCVSQNVPVDIKNKHGETPLLRAFVNENPEILEYLLKNKANVNQLIDDEGNTLLHKYVERLIDLAGVFEPKLLEALLKYNSNKTIKNKAEKTAYDVLSERNEPSYKEFLTKIKP